MNKTPITIWVNLIEPGVENNKIIVKKGNFWYNNVKYNIDNGYILPATTEGENND